MPIETSIGTFFLYLIMNFQLIKTHSILKKIFSNYVWDIPNNEKKVYLTFDDGPTPEITQWTLNLLENYNAKATFFCIGGNVKKYPEIFKNVILKNHSIGNHTFNHLNGWKTSTVDYIENVKIAENRLQKAHEFFKIEKKIIKNGSLKPVDLNLKSAMLFRPPYGKIKPSQSKILRKLGYKIIMWDVISYDFNTTISPQKCLENVLKNVKPGSIIVFHDSQKAFKNLEYVLPKTLEFLSEKGFICEKIN